MESKDKLKQYFIKNKYTSIQDTGLTWDQLANKLNISSGEAARSMYRRHVQTKPVHQFGEVFENFMEDHGLNPNLATSARYITHLGKDKATFNVTLKTAGNNGFSYSDIDKYLDSIDISTPIYNYTPKAKTGEATLIVNLSDQHIGMAIPKNFFNFKWDMQIHYERLAKVLQYIEWNKNFYDIDRIIINYLGDFVDGQSKKTVRGLKNSGSHDLPQYMSDSEMYENGVDSILFFVNNVIDITDKSLPIEIHFVGNSNHGGVLDYTIGSTAKKIYDQMYPNLVDFEVHTRFIDLYNTRNYNILITHGYDENEMTKFGKMPMVINDKWLDNIKTIKEYLGANQKYKTILYRGDMHVSSYRRYPTFDDILCPALTDPSDYIQHNFINTVMPGGCTMSLLFDHMYFNQTIEF